MTTPDDKEHDKLLCERLATTVDHGICKCAERHRIAELEAELAAERGRRAEAEPEKVHQATVYLGVDGLAWLSDGGYTTVARPIIRWTNDGRVWIESADHRRSASELRRRAALWLRSESVYGFAATCARAADLLDGGQPC